MSTTKRAGTLFATVVLYTCVQTGLASCAATMPEVEQESKPSPPGPRSSVESELEERVRRLEGAISLLQCGPPLKALMNSARQMCAAGGGDLANKTKCDAKRLKLPLVNAKQDLGEMQLGDYLLTTLRHEAVYLINGNDISERRKERLRLFANEPRQSTTRYLIVTGAEDGLQRAEVVRRSFSAMLQSAEGGHRSTLPEIDTVFEKPWLLSLPRSKPLGVDKPLPPGEPNEVNKVVFLIRTDCQAN